MYATAHRVYSRRRDRQGVNAFLHVHEGQSIDWDAPDALDRVADAEPGRCVAERILLLPGGNEVMSYLDLAGPDGQPVATVQEVLAACRERLGERPQRARIGQVSGRFGCVAGLRGAEELEFDELAAALLALLSSPRRTGASSPLRVLVGTDAAGGVEYRLDAESAERARRATGQPRERLSVGAARDVVEEFERLYGDLGPELALVLTGLSADDLVAAGGVRFVDARSGRTLREWPRPGA